MSQFFKTLKKVSNNEFAFTIDEENPYEVKSWIDTGCYALNAVLSNGDILKGIPMGKRIMISGESGVAKSLFVSIIIKAFLDQTPNSKVVMFESEASTVIEMAKQIGIPDDQILILPVQSVEEFRTQATNIVDKVIEVNDKIDAFNATAEIENAKLIKKAKGKEKPALKKLKERENIIMVLDSLGNLGTIAESNIITTDKRSKKGGAQTRDMTRAQLIRGMSRTISLKIAMAQIPLLMVNHTYKVMAEYAEDETSGGGGPKYMSDVSLVLTKAKEKDSAKKQIGIMITLKTKKSRYMKENKEVKVLISFTRGMYRFSDLVNKAAEFGVFKKANAQTFALPDGTEAKMADVRQKASRYIKGDTLELIRQAILADFGFGMEDGKFDFFDDIDEDIDDRDNHQIEDDVDMALEDQS